MKRLMSFLLFFFIRTYAHAAAVNTRFVVVSPVPFYTVIVILFIASLFAIALIIDCVRLYVLLSRLEHLMDKRR